MNATFFAGGHKKKKYGDFKETHGGKPLGNFNSLPAG